MNSTAGNIISVRDVSKSYGDVHALHQMSLDIDHAEIFGLIGPDGAGKTTLFRILATLLLPDTGTVEILGVDAVKEYKKLRKLIGYMPGRFSLYQDLTVEENLKFYATIFGTSIEENYHLIKDIYQQIEPFRKRRAGDLSGGMKQKLALSCALIHKPELLILDEPTTGVDAVSRREFWEMLIKLKQSGMTVLVSTPYMDEAGMCDHIALFQEGRILQLDSPEAIINGFDRKLLAVKAADIHLLIRDLQTFPDMESLQPFGEYLHYTSLSNNPEPEAIRNFLSQKGHTNIVMKEIRADIEDCFIRLMSKKQESHDE